MVDVNKPVTNPGLVEAMNRFLENRTAENELYLIKEITKANFLTPIIFNGEIENGVLKAQSTISFKMISNSAGESFFLAFTDWQELGKWSMEKEETLVTTYEDLKTLVIKDADKIKGFTINPFTQNIIITPELMEYFSHRNSEIVIKKETKIMLGQPAKYPHEMVKELADFFKRQKEVESAYLFLAHREGDEQPNLMLIIDFKGEKDVLFPQVAAVAQKYLGRDEYIDMVPMSSGFGADAVKNTEPFYKKKSWKLF